MSPSGSQRHLIAVAAIVGALALVGSAVLAAADAGETPVYALGLATVALAIVALRPPAFMRRRADRALPMVQERRAESKGGRTEHPTRAYGGDPRWETGQKSAGSWHGRTESGRSRRTKRKHRPRRSEP